jgi:hypothetical protein
MEGTRPISDRQMKVARGFVWSRLESQLMASAYEYVWPIIRRRPPLAPRQLTPAERLKTVGRARRCATGA